MFLELFNLSANDFRITLAACSLASLFFLIYSFAIVINGKAIQIFHSRNPHIIRIVEDAFSQDLNDIKGPPESG